MSTKQTKHPGRRLLGLLLIIVIGFAGLYAGARTGRTSMTPGLALDLEGGTQIILTPTTTDGSEITDEDVNQAIEIIRQRVDASGVAEAQISRQGGQNIVVSLPGQPSEQTLELVRTSAVLYFRPVIREIPRNAQQIADHENERLAQQQGAVDQQAPTDGSAEEPQAPTEDATEDPQAPEVQAPPDRTDDAATAENSNTDADDLVLRNADANADDPVFRTVAEEATTEPGDGTGASTDGGTGSGDATTDGSATDPAATPTVTAEQFANTYADLNQDGTISADPLPSTSEDNSSDSWISEQMIYDAYMTDCTSGAALTGEPQDPSQAVISCDKSDTGAVYVLGPADIAGTDVKNATSTLETDSQGGATNRWVVSLAFDEEGTEQFSELSSRLIGYRDAAATAGASGTNDPTMEINRQKSKFAIVLDGLTISASGFDQDVISGITDGKVMIRGGFDKKKANTLANQLSFGSLPLSFTVQSEQQISATLGSEQLRNGLIAGLVGFALIIVYLAWQYRGLSVVAVSSLVVAAAVTYLAIAMLSWWMGYRLSLAGVAGLIISIGITVDSFIIYFERVRDEVRHGRTLVAAVDEGWKHARQTIIVSDTVNLLAAVVLYFLAVGGVQGFAFTLGVTTVVDLAVIVLFTHPMLVWIRRFRFYGEGHRLSGLDPEHLGAHSAAAYGKGRQALAEGITGTLARRKAQARRKNSSAGGTTDAGEADVAVDPEDTSGKDGGSK